MSVRDKDLPQTDPVYLLFDTCTLALLVLKKTAEIHVGPYISSSGQGTVIAPKIDQCIFGAVMLEKRDGNLFSQHENF